MHYSVSIIFYSSRILVRVSQHEPAISGPSGIKNTTSTSTPYFQSQGLRARHGRPANKSVLETSPLPITVNTSIMARSESGLPTPEPSQESIHIGDVVMPEAISEAADTTEKRRLPTSDGIDISRPTKRRRSDQSRASSPYDPTASANGFSPRLQTIGGLSDTSLNPSLVDIADFELLDVPESSSLPYELASLSLGGVTSAARTLDGSLYLPPGMKYIIDSKLLLIHALDRST